MTNEAKINTNIHNAVSLKAEELSKKRVTWEEGTYKRSNEELYELLSECLDFYLDLRGNTEKCKALNDHLRNSDIKFQESSSLPTRIVRAVFKSSFQKRAYSYARVIAVAAAEKTPTESMSQFITTRGGVEEIRRTKQNGKSPKDVRKDRIAYAQDTLSKAAALVEPFKVNASQRELAEGAEHNLFVAIMRQEADGSYSMLYETGASAVVNAALEQAGKDNEAEKQRKEAEEQKRKDAVGSEQAAQDAAERAELANAA